MTWINSGEIEDALEQFQRDPVLGPAAKYLDDYKEKLDSCTDGWSSWSGGTKCASDLCKILADAEYNRIVHARGYIAPTRESVVKACKKIENFILTNECLKHKITPPVLADAVQLVF